MKNAFWLLLGIALMSCGQEESVCVISTDFGDIVLEFYEDVAPMHVESFKLLAEAGYFDGSTFHRVIPGFVIQGGDPNSKDDIRDNDGMGGHAGKYYGIGKEDDPETWMLPAEFNDSLHTRGTLSMARASDPNSAGSQFFICVADVHQLDHKYTVFGQVIKGMEVVDHIVNLPRDRRDNPLERAVLTTKIMKRSQALKE